MIIYLHGFGSTGSSSKVESLKTRFGAENVYAPDLPIDPDEVITIIRKHVHNWSRSETSDDNVVFVGISLGAFYASYFAHIYDSPSVIVNPSVRPNKTLESRLGRNENFVTKEEFWVTLAHLDKLTFMRDYMAIDFQGSLINLFVAKDDEILPYQEMLDWYQYTASTMIVETGGHRFLDHWDKVVDKIAELI